MASATTTAGATSRLRRLHAAWTRGRATPMPEPRGDQLASSLPRNYMRSCILLLLREEPAHGYDLLQRLRPLGFERDDPGRLYRALRWLEGEKLVRSTWEPSETGPDRR